MPKRNAPWGSACRSDFQHTLDALDVIGRWEWDAETDDMRADAFVALVYNVDPLDAEEGVPMNVFLKSMPADDRERVQAAIKQSARDGGPFLVEHRVVSADDQTRWVLVRGRFMGDHAGRPVRGSGILLDITRMRMMEGTFGKVEDQADEAPLNRAADHAIAAQQAIVEVRDAELKVHADTLLLALGHRLAQQQVQSLRQRMN